MPRSRSNIRPRLLIILMVVLSFVLSLSTQLFPSWTASFAHIKASVAVLAQTGNSCSAVAWANPVNVSPSGNSITKYAGGNSWNAGASSQQYISSGDGYVEMTVQSTAGSRLFGLSNGDTDAGWSDVNFGIIADDPAYGTGLEIREGNASRAVRGPYQAGDKLRVAVEYDSSLGRRVVNYYQQSAAGTVLLYSNTNPAITYPLLVDTSIHHQNTTITNLQLCGAQVVSPAGPATLPAKAVAWANPVNVSPSGNSITKYAGGNSWNAGASSQQYISSGDGYVEMTVQSTAGSRLFGLSNGDTDAGWSDVDFGIIADDPAYGAGLEIREGNVSRAIRGTYQAGDKLRVAVEYDAALSKTVVRYYRITLTDTIVLYTNANPSITYPLLVDTSIHHQNTSITNLQLCGAQVVTPPGPATLPAKAAAWANPVNVSPSGNSIMKYAGGGSWNAGASSQQYISSGDGYVEMTMQSTAGSRLFGLSNGDADAGWSDVDFGIIADDPAYGAGLEIREGSISRAVRGTYQAGDKLRVAVEYDAALSKTVVRYYRTTLTDTIVLYTNTNPQITYPLRADTSIFHQSRSITSVSIAAQELRVPALPTCSQGALAQWQNLANVSPSGNSITKNMGGNSWNAGASSQQYISSGKGYVEMTVQSTAGSRLFGLSNGDTDAGWSDVDFGIIADGPAYGTVLEIREGNISRAIRGTYQAGDKLRVAVEYDAALSKTVVRYYRITPTDTIVLYTNTDPLITYPLLVDSSIFTLWEQIGDALLCVAADGSENTPNKIEIGADGSPSTSKTTCSSPQPINCVTGNFWHTFTDAQIPEKGTTLLLNRTYNTQNAGKSGPLGRGWTHSYNMYIEQDQHGNYLVHEENGSVITFGSDFSHPPRVMATLTNTNAAYVFARTHGQERFIFRPVSATLRLAEIVDRNGLTTTLAYQDELLRTVTGPAGRSLTFTYTNELLTAIGDPGNRTISFAYTGGDLTAATDLGGQTTYFTYDSAHRMLTMTDPLGRALTNSYDSQDRVVRQTDFVSNTLELRYGANSTTITNSLGLVVVQAHANNMLLAESLNPGQQQANWTYAYKPGTTWIASQTDPNGNTWSYTWDDAGNVTSETDPLGHTSFYTYTNRLLPGGETAALLLAQQDALGRVTRYGYNDLGRPVAITNTLDQATHVEYNAAGQVERVVDTAGVAICHEYDASANLAAVIQNCRPGETATAARNVRTEYGYDALGRRTWQRDPSGEVTRIFYGPDNRVLKSVRGCALNGAPSTSECDAFDAGTSHLNRTTLFGYDAFGRQVAVTDTLGIATHTDYDALGRPFRHTGNYVSGGPVDAATNVSSLTEYDAASRVSAFVDPLGRRSVTQYDSLGRVSATIRNYVDGDPLTGSQDADLATRTGYDTAGRPVTTTLNYVDGAWNPNRPDEDVASVTRYDQLGRVSSVVESYANGVVAPGEIDTDRITRYLYDAVGNTVAITDPLGIVAVTVYDALNRPVERIDNCTDGAGNPRASSCAAGHGAANDENIRTSLAYTQRGEPETATDALGRVERSSYDPLGRLAELTANENGAVAPANVKTRYAYDVLGHTTVLTDALGAVWRNEYNPAGWLASRLDPTQRELRFRYDGMGRQAARIDELDRETRTLYDALGRPVKTVANWRNGVVESGDGADEDLASETVYDAAGRRVAVLSPGGKRTSFSYDGLDRLVGVVENASGIAAPANVTTTYAYDRLGRLTSTTDALGHVRHSAYNAAGWQVSQTDALSRTTTFGYDRGGRRVSVADARPVTAGYAYDALGRLTSIAAAGLSTITMQYDAAGRRTSLADGTGNTAYSYDGLDRLVEAGHSLDGAVSYGYDLLGRRTSIGTSTGAPAVTYDYDPAGRLEQVDRAGVAHASATYDALGRLATLSRANGAITAYGYDGVDRLVRLHTTAGSTVLSSFGYTMSRGSQVVLASETITTSTRSIAYSYDGLQRLVGASEQPGSSYGYSYDLVGNRTQVVKDGVTVESHAYDAADQVVGRQYDAAGNLLSDGTSAYSYDALNRLYALAQGGITTTFAYNGDGVLASETSGATTTRYTLDTAGGLSERLGATTAGSTTWYIRGWGQELSSGSGGASSWYVADRLGSVRALLNSSGGVTAGYNYDPFGTPQGSGSADYGFSGEPQYSTGGLVQLRARWYSSGSGLFITRDPFPGKPVQPMSLAYYMYAFDDPAGLVDPTGRFPIIPGSTCLSWEALGHDDVWACIGSGFENMGSMVLDYFGGAGQSYSCSNMGGWPSEATAWCEEKYGESWAKQAGRGLGNGTAFATGLLEAGTGYSSMPPGLVMGPGGTVAVTQPQVIAPCVGIGLMQGAWNNQFGPHQVHASTDSGDSNSAAKPQTVPIRSRAPGLTRPRYDSRNGHGIYVLKDQDGVVRYVGRGDAPDRIANHTNDPAKRKLTAQIVANNNLTFDEARGLEQLLIEHFGGARSEGGTSLVNADNGVGPRNRNRSSYIDAGLPLLEEALEIIRDGH